MSDIPDPSTETEHCPECGSRYPAVHKPIESHLVPGVVTLCSDVWHLQKRLAAIDNRTEKLAGELRQQGKNHTKGMNTLEHVFREYLDLLFGWATRVAHDNGQENPPAPPW